MRKSLAETRQQLADLADQAVLPHPPATRVNLWDTTKHVGRVSGFVLAAFCRYPTSPEDPCPQSLTCART